MAGKKLLFCNVDFDTDLTGTRSCRQRQSCLEARFYYCVCGGAGDKIILDAAPHETYLSYLSDQGIVTPQICSDGATLSDYAAFPWGWSESVIGLFQRFGAKVHHPPLESVRAVNSRRFCHRVAQRLGLGIAGSKICESAEETRTCIRACRAFPLVIKPEHGNAGIGFIHLSSPEQADDGRIDRLFPQPGAASVVEPWVKRVADISSRFRLDSAGRTGAITHHRTLNNRAGVYLGNLLGPEDPLVAKWRNRLDEGVSVSSLELHAAGYFGPAGLDWIIHKENGTGKETCALVDINARQPMSFVADCLRARLAGNRYCLFQFAPRRGYPALTDYDSWYRGCGPYAFDVNRGTGILLFTPLSYAAGSTEHRPLRHGFFMVGDTEEEILAYNRFLRNAFKPGFQP